jgi:hypothetical protein
LNGNLFSDASPLAKLRSLKWLFLSDLDQIQTLPLSIVNMESLKSMRFDNAHLVGLKNFKSYRLEGATLDRFRQEMAARIAEKQKLLSTQSTVILLGKEGCGKTALENVMTGQKYIAGATDGVEVFEGSDAVYFDSAGQEAFLQMLRIFLPSSSNRTRHFLVFNASKENALETGHVMDWVATLCMGVKQNSVPIWFIGTHVDLKANEPDEWKRVLSDKLQSKCISFKLATGIEITIQRDENNGLCFWPVSNPVKGFFASLTSSMDASVRIVKDTLSVVAIGHSPKGPDKDANTKAELLMLLEERLVISKNELENRFDGALKLLVEMGFLCYQTPWKYVVLRDFALKLVKTLWVGRYGKLKRGNTTYNVQIRGDKWALKCDAERGNLPNEFMDAPDKVEWASKKVKITRKDHQDTEEYEIIFPPYSSRATETAMMKCWKSGFKLLQEGEGSVLLLHDLKELWMASLQVNQEATISAEPFLIDAGLLIPLQCASDQLRPEALLSQKSFLCPLLFGRNKPCWLPKKGGIFGSKFEFSQCSVPMLMQISMRVCRAIGDGVRETNLSQKFWENWDERKCGFLLQSDTFAVMGKGRVKDDGSGVFSFKVSGRTAAESEEFFMMYNSLEKSLDDAKIVDAAILDATSMSKFLQKTVASSKRIDKPAGTVVGRPVNLHADQNAERIVVCLKCSRDTQQSGLFCPSCYKWKSGRGCFGVRQIAGAGAAERAYEGETLTGESCFIKVCESGHERERVALSRLSVLPELKQLIPEVHVEMCSSDMLVTSYFDGESGRDVWLTDNEVGTISFMEQLLRILKSCHSAGVYHCDVSKRNVMKIGDKWVLIDFGEACVEKHPEFEKFDMESLSKKALLIGDDKEKYSNPRRPYHDVRDLAVTVCDLWNAKESLMELESRVSVDLYDLLRKMLIGQVNTTDKALEMLSECKKLLHKSGVRTFEK